MDTQTKTENRLIWKGRITLNTYQGVPCGDDIWKYEVKNWGQGEFDVRLILDPEGGLRSEYLSNVVRPDALKPEVETWPTLYKNNHTDVLEACLINLLSEEHE